MDISELEEQGEKLASYNKSKALHVPKRLFDKTIREFKKIQWDNNRLRFMIDGAPHAEDCLEPLQNKNCNCWKSRVLEGYK